MIAISIPNRTIYDCNLFQKWPNMIAMAKFGLESRGFLDESRENKFSFIAIIFGPFWKRLESYMVQFIIEIAFILSPYCDQDYNHIWSPS